MNRKELERKRDAALIELARRRRDERIRYFVPHGGQQEFIDEIARPGAFVVMAGAGNGWGKSEILVAIFAAVMWPDLAPPCFGHPFFKDFPHPKRARISSTPKELEEIGSLQTAIKKYFPKGRYTSKKKGKAYPCEFTTDSGWVLDLMSYEQGVSEYAGPNIGLQGFNEPPPEDIYKESMARARAGGIAIGAMTSLMENPWIVSGIFERANGDDIRVRYGDVEENCRQHGKSGHLDHEQVEKILAQYDPDEREARKTGRPLSFSGRIFKGFNRDVHVAKEELIPEQGSATYMVCDPAIGKPLACIWAYVTKQGQVVIYDEWPEFDFEGSKDSNIDVKGYADIFKSREIYGPIQTRILDRHFGNARRTVGGQTLKQEFDDVGIEFSDSYSMAPDVEVETGIYAVKKYLRYDKDKPISNLNQPKLMISPKCRNTIKAMERWSRNPNTAKPMDEFKDFADCVRYLVMANPEIDTPEPQIFGKPTSPQYGVGNV